MNTMQSMQVTAAGYAHPADASSTSCAQAERRESTRAVLRKKYDTMLNMAELIIAFHPSAIKGLEHEKAIREMRSLIEQTRKGLHISKPAGTASAE